uniref:Golgi resident protein GCP60 n=1 Tax=Cacopsylla melanoneura TaxID=428564 RepID=A0A8D8S5Y5_9HEMI
MGFAFKSHLSISPKILQSLHFIISEMEGKAVNLSYEDKIKLVALFKQVVFGKCNEENLPQLGVLDVIGKNRRLAWKELGGMSANDAMLNFINLLDDKCSLFKPYIDAHVAQKEEENRKQQKNKEKIEQEEKEKLDQANGEVNQETSIEEKKRRLIQDALNQQTYAQFRAYAEDQFPGNPEQQAVLVRQLQDQHYLQYMQQILHAHDQQPNSENKAITDIIPDSSIIQQTQEEEISEIGPANMWTLTNIKSFKEHIRKEGGDAIIKIGHGETVTVRVPTHEGGSCLYWEFCTDHYDLGFGIYFEWNKSPTNQVSVHVSETDDEMMSDVDAAYEDDDDDDDEEGKESTISSGSQAPVTVDMMEKMFRKYTKITTDKLVDFEKSVQHNSNQLDDFLTTFNQMKEQLSKMQVKQDKLEHENTTLKKTVREMKSHLMENEQKLLNKNLEVNGIPENINDQNVIMNVLCKKANVSLPTGNSYELERATTGALNKPKVVIIRFQSKLVRDSILKGCKARRTNLADFTGISQDNEKAVYVNEQLSPTNKKLFYEANQIRKEKKYEFLWFADNKILMKKTKESRAIRIYSKEDVM